MNTYQELDIAKMITISTAHISLNTAMQLHRASCKNAIMSEDAFSELIIYEKSDYGWFIYVSENLFEFDEDDPIDQARKEYISALPEDLKTVLSFAISNQCEWLCLDQDGMVVDLPTFNW